MSKSCGKTHALDPECLRWSFDESRLNFETTAEVDPCTAAATQPIAMEALKFGLESRAPGQNIFVRGISGTGRMNRLRGLLEQLDPEARRRLDRCYVHNFEQPERPRLLTLPAGHGTKLCRGMREVVNAIDKDLPEAMEDGPLKARRDAIQKTTQQAIDAITAPMEKKLEAAGLAVVKLNQGRGGGQTAIFPVIDGKAVPPEEFKSKAAAGEVEAEALQRYEQHIEEYTREFTEVAEKATRRFRKGADKARRVMESEARRYLEQTVADLRRMFADSGVDDYLDEVIKDVVENRLFANPEKLPPADELYAVNVVCQHGEHGPGPVIVETTPSVANLIGSIEPEWGPGGKPRTSYRSIRAGALVQADGGVLVLDVRDVLMEPGAWRLLMRALRTGTVDIVPGDMGWPYAMHTIKPESIDISVRVILLGSSRMYYQLDAVDQDFSDLFKVLADFNPEIDRDLDSVQQYAGILARLGRQEDLLPFDRSAVAALAEHGARIAARGGKISAHFDRIADIAREAALLAGQADQTVVQRAQVEETVRRTKYRASLPSRRFQDLMQDGTINVQTDGAVVGQINGLAVIHAGPLTYGFPSRITATIGAGRRGITDIESEARMSGSIHTKGFAILEGLLRHLLRTDHPLTFSASLAFEQSYGGIDGDSASGAEICCLLSALTDIPIRQTLAMTGAIDQHGRLQAIGGANEKIEGFFDACQANGLSGDQGVIIPRANADDLMLRQDVVSACDEGRFTVYAVARIEDALQILTGVETGEPDASGDYPEDSLLYRARQQAYRYWSLSLAKPLTEE